MRNLICVALLAITLSACGGGGGGSSSGGGSTPIANAAVGGIWTGKDPISSADVVGLIAEDGRAQFVVFDGGAPTQYWGTLSTSGNNISSSNVQVADDLTYFGTAAISGTITARQSMTISVSFTPAAGCAASVCGTARTGSGPLTFNAIYNRGGALSRVVGNWRDVVTSQIYNINASGVVFLQDAVTGCIINGQVSTINTSFNAYSATYTYTSCRIPYTALNNTTATGLVAVDDTVSPNRIVLGAQYRASGTTYTVYGEATKL